MTIELTDRETMTVVGFAVRTSNARAMEDIPGLWQRALAARLHQVVPQALPGMIAAYTEYEDGHRGPYTMIVGVPVPRLDVAPAGLRLVTVPAGRYARFCATGDPARAVPEAWQRIWAECDHRAYRVDVEVHDPGVGTVEIYVGVV